MRTSSAWPMPVRLFRVSFPNALTAVRLGHAVERCPQEKVERTVMEVKCYSCVEAGHRSVIVSLFSHGLADSRLTRITQVPTLTWISLLARTVGMHSLILWQCMILTTFQPAWPQGVRLSEAPLSC